MKILNLLMATLIGASMVSCSSFSTKVNLETETDSVSYLMGAVDGEQRIKEFERAGLDTILNLDEYFKAFLAGANSEELAMNPDSNATYIQSFIQEFQQMRMAASNPMDTIPSKGFEGQDARIDSVSYLLGAADGKGIVDGFERAGFDSIFNIELYLKGMMQISKGEELVTDMEAEDRMSYLQTYFEAFQERKLEEEFGANKLAGEEFLAKNGALEDITVTASGLQYEVITEGNGEKPAANSKVKVHYHGTLLDGTVFDSSVDRGEPAEFGVNQVIPGWTEALQLMSVGAKYKLFIPYNLAYGTRNAGPTIKPFSMLIFEVELLEIVK